MFKNTFKSLVILGTVIAMIACGSNTNSFNSDYVPLSNASKLLRSPDGLDHSYTYEQYSDPNYKAFKVKLSAFANKIAEAFANREYKQNENIVISPFSIEMCIGLAVRSSNNQTRKEMLDAIGVDFETFNKYYKLFFNEKSFESYDIDKKIEAQLLITNSIWVDDELHLKNDGLDALRDDYYCYSYQVDFDKKNEQACKDIQSFINQKTKGLINPDIELDSQTLFVLMNTLYLKDIWKQDGSDLQYADKSVTFTNIDKTVSNKQLLTSMYTSGKTLTTDDYTSFYATTKHGISLRFIKPNEGKSVQTIFNKENMDYVLNRENYVFKDDEKLERYYTNCIFPEFEVDSDLTLNTMFVQDLGIQSLLNPTTCDFSSITTDAAFVSKIRHLAKLKVNKTGVEGAAVTYMEAPGSAGPGEYTNIYETFIVDKEFGFILSEGDTVLFSGIVTNIDK